MTISLFNRAVATSMLSLYRTERELRVQQAQGSEMTPEHRRALAEAEIENARAIRIAQAAMAGATLDILS